MRRAAIAIALIIGLTIVNEARQAATDVTQWRGANRDGVVTGFTAPATWPEQLTKRWTVDVGLGYSTPIVVGNRVYAFGRQGADEVMTAIDAASGKVLWRTAYPAAFEMSSAAKSHGPGPKATPVFFNGRLYAIGMAGHVTAYDAATGKQLWQKPGSMPLPMYTSHSFSPVVDRGLVIFHVGGHDKGAITAFDLTTGAEKWSWAGDGPGYGSPIIAEFGGVRQLVTITQSKLVGIDVGTGALLWERPFASSNFTNSITPLRVGESVVVWNNNGPMRAVTIARRDSKWVAEEAWTSDDPPNRLSNTVLDGDVMFGMTQRNMGQYYAVDVKTGKTLWASEGRQAANVAVARAGNLIFSLENDGELVIFRASRTAFEPVARYRVASEEMFSTWSQPAISGNRIFIKDASTVALWTLN
jgi:outer membrane protein assembly factor BamB